MRELMGKAFARLDGLSLADWMRAQLAVCLAACLMAFGIGEASQAWANMIAIGMIGASMMILGIRQNALGLAAVALLAARQTMACLTLSFVWAMPAWIGPAVTWTSAFLCLGCLVAGRRMMERQAKAETESDASPKAPSK